MIIARTPNVRTGICGRYDPSPVVFGWYEASPIVIISYYFESHKIIQPCTLKKLSDSDLPFFFKKYVGLEKSSASGKS